MDSQYDQILLEGLIFTGYVGFFDFEKEQGQPFQIDVVLHCARLTACDNDNLDETIDYGDVSSTIGQIMEKARFNLIERLAGKIAGVLLGKYPLCIAVDVTVRKPQAPLDIQFSAMGVHIRRERS